MDFTSLKVIYFIFMNLVSVIILTYNRASLVKESIESVLSQTYSNLELLVIDDGSSDGTENVVKEFNDDRLKYFWLDHTGRTGPLKNFALGKARGSYIAFNDSDDNWKVDKLAKQMKLFTECPTIGFSITDVITYSAERIIIDHSYHGSQPFECRNIFEWLIHNRFLVYNNTLVIRKECFEKTGLFDESMLSGDYHFMMRLAYHFTVGILYEPLVWRRVHDSNTSEQFPFENYQEFIATFEHLYRNKWVEKRHLRSARSVAFYKMGQLLEKKGEFLRARRSYLKSIRQRWFHFDSYMGLIKTFIGKPVSRVNNK